MGDQRPPILHSKVALAGRRAGGSQW